MIQIEKDPLEVLRQSMFRWRDRFLMIALPVWAALNWIGLQSGSQVLAPMAHLALAVCGVLFWRALYRYARASDSSRYAVGQLLLAILLTPVFFAGVWAMPSLVASDIESDVPRQRAENAPPLWFVALDTLVAFAVLGICVALVGFLGIVGLFLAAVTAPLLYGAFRAISASARS